VKTIWSEESKIICSICKKEFPATRDYFFLKKNGRYGLTRNCINCVKEYDRKRYLKNPEKNIENSRRYKLENKEYCLEWQRKYNITHREEKNRYCKEYYQKNKERRLKEHKEWKKTEQGRKISNFHKKTHISWRRRIGKILKKDFTLKDWENCLEYFDYSCAYCGSKDDLITMEHFIPVFSLGETTKKNIIPSCVRCNSSKKNNIFEDWYKKQTFYSEDRKQKIIRYIL
jgi:hypothetical protein